MCQCVCAFGAILPDSAAAGGPASRELYCALSDAVSLARGVLVSSLAALGAWKINGGSFTNYVRNPRYVSAFRCQVEPEPQALYRTVDVLSVETFECLWIVRHTR